MITLLFGLVFSSCDDKRQIRQVYNQTIYDTDIIRNLPLYDSLKSILILNIDTIFKFRNSRHFVFHSYTNGDTATVQENSYFYHFYYNYDKTTAHNFDTILSGENKMDEINDETIPAFIYSSVDNVIRRLGKSKITDFLLHTDSSIDISVKDVSKKDIDIRHSLIWKSIFAKNTDPDQFYRDTLIAPKWTYRIWVGKHQGW